MKKILVITLALSLTACTFTTPVNNNSNPKPTDKVTTTPIAPNGSVLDLSNRNLDKLPVYVLSLTSLTELDISNNKLSGALPAEIRQLKNLKKLDASNNAMTGIPAEIGQLSQLEDLNFASNQLTGLPYEIGNLTKLKLLNLTGNNFSQQDLLVIQEKLPNLKVIY